ncbi:MAG: hypothetical protein AAF587_27720 [Bacteroidota bacterium]
MKIEDQKFIRISRYLDKDMLPNEQSEFEQDMSANHELSLQVRYVQELMRGVKDMALRQDMSDLWDQQTLDQHPATTSFPIWKIVGLAASVLLIAIGIWNMNQDSPTEALVKKWLSPDVEFKSNMSSADHAELLEQIESNLVNKDYQNSREGALDLLKMDGENIYAHYLLGIAEVGTGSYKRAILHLKLASATKDEQLGLRVQWWLALALVGSDQLDEARRILSDIISSPIPHYRKQGAEELLGILDGEDPG